MKILRRDISKVTKDYIRIPKIHKQGLEDSNIIVDIISEYRN